MPCLNKLSTRKLFFLLSIAHNYHQCGFCSEKFSLPQAALFYCGPSLAFLFKMLS